MSELDQLKAELDQLKSELERVTRQRDEAYANRDLHQRLLAEKVSELENVKLDRDESVDLLKQLAAMPLEEFGWQEHPDSRVLWRANDWQLTIGMIKKARELSK